MSVLDLRATQEWFATAMTTGDSVDHGMARAGQAAGFGHVTAVVTGGPRMSARDRLGVYHHAYRARLVECLADDYPALRNALGADAFERLCHAYLVRHPSTSFSLNFFGASMSCFCRGIEEPWGRFASDLAALEWAMVEAIHAPGAARIEAADLVGLSQDDWSARRLVPSAALRIVRSSYPVNDYYQSFRSGTPCAELPEPARSTTAISRADLTVWRTRILPALVPVLDALVAGMALGDALGMAIASEAEVSGAFRDWISAGIFVAVQ